MKASKKMELPMPPSYKKWQTITVICFYVFTPEPEHLKAELWTRIQSIDVGFQNHYREEKFKCFERLKNPPHKLDKPI